MRMTMLGGEEISTIKLTFCSDFTMLCSFQALEYFTPNSKTMS